jgi:hypothetical protein
MHIDDIKVDLRLFNRFVPAQPSFSESLENMWLKRRTCRVFKTTSNYHLPVKCQNCRALLHNLNFHMNNTQLILVSFDNPKYVETIKEMFIHEEQVRNQEQRAPNRTFNLMSQIKPLIKTSYPSWCSIVHQPQDFHVVQGRNIIVFIDVNQVDKELEWLVTKMDNASMLFALLCNGKEEEQQIETWFSARYGKKIPRCIEILSKSKFQGHEVDMLQWLTMYQVLLANGFM